MEWIVISVVQVLDPEDETVTCGNLYNFTVMNSTVTGHLGKIIISPNWWNQFWWNMCFWIRDMLGCLITKFQTHMCSNFGDIIEIVIDISAEEIGKLGLLVPGASLHYFQKRSTLDILPWKFPYLYPIKSFKFQVLEIRVSLRNPRSSSSRN